MTEFEVQEVEEIFDYLDDLRESGVTNMFGAGAYVEADFGLNRRAASRIVGMWMRTFDGKSSVADRAEKALAA